MNPHFSFEAKGLLTAIDAVEGQIAQANTRAMKDVADGLKRDLRQEVLSQGMGQKLANTWRSKVYPDRRNSLTPAAYVYSNAPKIIDAFSRNPLIVAVNGSKYLAIPTKNTPRKTARRLMTPVEVEALFNQDLTVVPGKLGHLLAFVRAIAANNKKGFRPVTKGRVAKGRAVKLVLMFTFVKFVRPGKRFDLQSKAENWAAAAPELVSYYLDAA